MKVTIEIECDEWKELTGHIQTIRKELKKRILEFEATPESSVQPQKFEDNNCYGTHEVTIDFDV